MVKCGSTRYVHFELLTGRVYNKMWGCSSQLTKRSLLFDYNYKIVQTELIDYFELVCRYDLRLMSFYSKANVFLLSELSLPTPVKNESDPAWKKWRCKLKLLLFHVNEHVNHASPLLNRYYHY